MKQSRSGLLQLTMAATAILGMPMSARLADTQPRPKVPVPTDFNKNVADWATPDNLTQMPPRLSKRAQRRQRGKTKQLLRLISSNF